MSEDILKDIRLAEKEIDRRREQAEEQAAKAVRDAEASARRSIEAKVQSLKEHEQRQRRIFEEEVNNRSRENSEVTKNRIGDLQKKATEKSAAAVDFIYEEFFKAVL
jgi:vacuolar-type H+-ATPase subunit H